VTIHADASIRAALIDADERVESALDPARIGYLFVARGSVHVNGQALRQGDAARLDGESRLVLDHADAAEVLLFDLAPLN
jgi:redox-sensitive bicupin YhaK (pirin superfamily)